MNQVQYCEDNKIPYMIIVGGKEKESGGLKIRNVKTRQEVCLSVSSNRCQLIFSQEFVKYEVVVEEIKKHLNE